MNSFTDIQSLRQGLFTLLDLRPSQEFIQGFVPGSVHIPFSRLEKNFELLRGLPPIVLFGTEADSAAQWLSDKGISVEGTIDDATKLWQDAGYQLDMIIQIEADEYAMDKPFDDRLLLIDVRSTEAYEAEHVAEAISMPLQSFSDVLNIASVDDDNNVYLHCGGGSSAVTVASLFKKQGFHNVRIIEGGFDALKNEPKVKTIKPDSKQPPAENK